MINHTNITEFDSRPFHEFKHNMSFLMFESDNNNFKNLVTKLYSIISACHEEYLAIINASLRINNRIKNLIEKNLKKSRIMLEKVLEDEKFDKEDEYNRYKISQHVSSREDGFRTLEKEIEIQSISNIVMLLSLLESTLFDIIQEFSKYDLEKFPDIKSVLKKDRGIAKYLKYLDKNLNAIGDNFIVGTPIYNEILNWVSIRNNIVHNSNKINEELYNSSLKYGIEIKYGVMNKFRFNIKSVIQLGELVGLTLNTCIVKGFYEYFNVEFIELDGFFGTIIVQE